MGLPPSVTPYPVVRRHGASGGGKYAVPEHHGQIRSQGSASPGNLGLSEQKWSERAARRPASAGNIFILTQIPENLALMWTGP
jgi:hypothetical protein